MAATFAVDDGFCCCWWLAAKPYVAPLTAFGVTYPKGGAAIQLAAALGDAAQTIDAHLYGHLAAFYGVNLLTERI